MENYWHKVAGSCIHWSFLRIPGIVLEGECVILWILFQRSLEEEDELSEKEKERQEDILAVLMILLDKALIFLNAIRFSGEGCLLNLFKAFFLFWIALEQSEFHQGTGGLL